MTRLRLHSLVAGLLLTVLLAGRAAGAEAAALSNVKTEWQNLYGAILYQASAQVQNTTGKPLRYVKVKLELFDKAGKRVAEQVGYNLAAEILADDAVPGTLEEKLARVKPIAPGGQDALRLAIDKADIPGPFRTAKLSVVEAR